MFPYWKDVSFYHFKVSTQRLVGVQSWSTVEEIQKYESETCDGLGDETYLILY